MRKGFCVFGIIVSLVIVTVGILLLVGIINVKPESSYFYNYDSGFAVFGGDFYTHVNNNAAEAVGLIRVATGILIISLGAIGFCLFGALLGTKETNSASQNFAAISKSYVEQKKTVVDELPDL